MTEEKENNEEVMTRGLFMIAQRAVLYNTETKKYCVAKIARTGGGFDKKYGPWDIFGGHIDAGERIPEESMRREISEEAGIDVEKLSPLGVIDFSGYGAGDDKERQRILIVYLATCDTEDITLSDEHKEYQWISGEEIQKCKDIKQWIKDFVTLAQKRLQEREALGGWQRCLADFDNHKKRQVENAGASIQYAKEGIVTSLLPVLDNFHASLDHVPAEHTDSPWVTGLGYIQKQLADVLGENGMSEMTVSVGDDFDPMNHEAIKEDIEEDVDNKESDDVQESEQKITKIVTRGYMMGDKVIRPARVTVR